MSEQSYIFPPETVLTRTEQKNLSLAYQNIFEEFEKFVILDCASRDENIDKDELTLHLKELTFKVEEMGEEFNSHINDYYSHAVNSGAPYFDDGKTKYDLSIIEVNAINANFFHLICYYLVKIKLLLNQEHHNKKEIESLLKYARRSIRGDLISKEFEEFIKHKEESAASEHGRQGGLNRAKNFDKMKNSIKKLIINGDKLWYSRDDFIKVYDEELNECNAKQGKWKLEEHSMDQTIKKWLKKGTELGDLFEEQKKKNKQLKQKSTH